MGKNLVGQGIELIDEMSDSELNQLVDYIRATYKTRRAQQNAKVKSTLEVGDRVVIRGRMKPQYLTGLFATVEGFGDSRVNIKLDRPVGKFRTGELRITAGALEKVS